MTDKSANATLLDSKQFQNKQKEFRHGLGKSRENAVQDQAYRKTNPVTNPICTVAPLIGTSNAPWVSSTCQVESKKHPTEKMSALCWHGKKKVSVDSKPRPVLTEPKDVILRITSTAICGSDLHLYLNQLPGGAMKSGDIMGHEFMGIVEDAGPEVTRFKKGDRVVSAFCISCGQCFFCNNGKTSSCDTSNPSKEEAFLYGDRTAGFFGYSHITGGWEGGQAEFVRVPFGDNNLLPIPDDMHDNDVLFLSDVLSTAWFGTELGEVGKDDIVAIWGAGPIGIMAAQCCWYRQAGRVILLDNEQYRLDFAKSKMPKVETINVKKTNALQELRRLCPLGPDVGMECVGFHYAKTLTHKIEMTLQLETDPSDILNEIVEGVRKGGRISIIGAYVGFCNHFNIGAFMEKGLTMKGGQTPVHVFWEFLLERIRDKSLDPAMIITHEWPLERAAEAYHLFNEKLDNSIKFVLKTQSALTGDGIPQHLWRQTQPRGASTRFGQDDRDSALSTTGRTTQGAEEELPTAVIGQ